MRSVELLAWTGRPVLQVGVHAARAGHGPETTSLVKGFFTTRHAIGLQTASSRRSVQNDKGATVAESPNEFLVLATIPPGMVGAVTRLQDGQILDHVSAS